ncbi:MAG: tyrosine-type recombinase/integrase [Burkholderiales bacterium]
MTEFQIKNAKAADKQQKLSDSGGLFLLAHPNGSKYWRMAYRFGGKQKILAVGKYPSTTLAQARLKRDEAKALLSDVKDPAEVVSMKAKKAVVAQEQETARIETALTFAVIAREWFELNSTKWKASHASKIINRLKADIFPWLGSKGIADLAVPQLLEALRRIEAPGAIETAHRALSDCSQIFRYAIASGRAERNIASDLRGALAPTNGTHFASIAEPAQIGELMRKIDGYGYGGGYDLRELIGCEQGMQQNVARDQRNIDQLLENGWRVIVVWECGLRTAESRIRLGSLLELILNDQISMIEWPPICG